MNQKQTFMILGGTMLSLAVAMFVVFENWLLALIFVLAGIAFIASSITQKASSETTATDRPTPEK